MISGLVQGHVIVALDRDTAGMKAAEATYDALRGQVGSLLSARFPDRSDPAQALVQMGPERLLQHLAQLRPLAHTIVDNHIDCWPNLHENAEARVVCLRELARVVARMTPEDATRQAARLTAILDLDQATITSEVTDAVTAPTTTRQPAPSLPASHYAASTLRQRP